jgi:hypothetical protein
MYQVDDGTAVIDCLHHSRMAVPLASLGDLVCVVGIIKNWRDSREIHVDKIGWFVSHLFSQ